MPPHFYNFLHIVGILMIFIGFGGILAYSMIENAPKKVRKLGAITSGIGLFIVLVAGFGLLAKLPQYDYDTPLILGKMLIWLILGGLTAAAIRLPKLAGVLWWVVLALGGIAVWLIYYGPRIGWLN
jgi:xanthine/uracil/vitamin C permease (AzgA family)